MEIKCLNYNERIATDKDEKMARCQEFFRKLAELLQGSHVVMDSCNKDLSQYLVPIGTEDQVTYYGKPVGSVRVSDHWTWYTNLNKCCYPGYIQCYSVDTPYARPRDPKYPQLATKGRMAYQVCYYGRDKKYHCVYGEKWDKKQKTWNWVEASPEEVVRNLRLTGEEESA